MFGLVRADPTESPYCTQGLQLCRCLVRDIETSPKGWDPNSMSYDVYNDSVMRRVIPEYVDQRRKLLDKMMQYNRAPLSKQWNTKIIPQPKTYRLPLNDLKSQMGREQTPLEKKRALRPITKDHHHQDSLFGNSFQSKSFFVVHPEWLSETVDNTDPEPLHRPPWPWEQPRYRQNIQLPITHKPVESEEDKNKESTEEEKYCMNGEIPMSHDMRMALPIGYTFTQPGIDITKPYAKQTQFGAPLVDTSVYKLSY